MAYLGQHRREAGSTRKRSQPRRFRLPVATSSSTENNYYQRKRENIMPNTKFLTTAEASHVLGVCGDHLRLLVRQGKIQCNKRGGRYVYSEKQLQKYAQGVPFAPKAKK